MARSKKTTVPQKLVNVATTGMPTPVRKYLGGRIVALLIVVSIPVLLASGVVSIGWENGRPRLSVNRKRAAELQSEAGEKIDDLRQDRGQDRPGLPKLIPQFRDQQDSRSRFAADWQRNEKFGDKVGERIEQLTDGFGEDPEPGWRLAPAPTEQEKSARQATRPLSKLKQRLENHR